MCEETMQSMNVTTNGIPLEGLYDRVVKLRRDTWLRETDSFYQALEDAVLELIEVRARVEDEGIEGVFYPFKGPSDALDQLIVQNTTLRSEIDRLDHDVQQYADELEGADDEIGELWDRIHELKEELYEANLHQDLATPVFQALDRYAALIELEATQEELQATSRAIGEAYYDFRDYLIEQKMGPRQIFVDLESSDDLLDSLHFGMNPCAEVFADGMGTVLGVVNA